MTSDDAGAIVAFSTIGLLLIALSHPLWIWLFTMLFKAVVNAWIRTVTFSNTVSDAIVNPFKKWWAWIQHDNIVEVLSEPERRRTSQLQEFEFLKVRTNDDSERMIYSNSEYTNRTWYFQDTHCHVGETFDKRIPRLLYHFRIDTATTLEKD